MKLEVMYGEYQKITRLASDTLRWNISHNPTAKYFVHNEGLEFWHIVGREIRSTRFSWLSRGHARNLPSSERLVDILSDLPFLPLAHGWTLHCARCFQNKLDSLSKTRELNKTSKRAYGHSWKWARKMEPADGVRISADVDWISTELPTVRGLHVVKRCKILVVSALSGRARTLVKLNKALSFETNYFWALWTQFVKQIKIFQNVVTVHTLP